jgi:uncharacterized membrane protein
VEPLLILLSITFTLVAFGLVVLVPILTWARSHRLERELKDLRARLAALEESISATRAATVDKPAAPAAPQVPTAELKFGPPPRYPHRCPTRLTHLSHLSHRAIDLPPLPAPEAPETLEAAIGGKVMLWVGTIVLVLGLAFFLKYAFDNDWINEPVRVGLGVIAGLALVWAGHRFVTSGYRAYGQILTGGGLAVMYLAIYAAFSYYELIGRTPAFVLLVAVTVGAAWLADRQNALGLALMGVGGGFATPFLFSSGVDAQVTLFSYDALLGVGTLYLARRRDWPVLNLVSFAFTWFTIGMWADRFYSPEKWRRTEFFLTLFCALFLVILVEQLKRPRLAQSRFTRAGAGPGDLPPLVAGDPVGPRCCAARLPDRSDAGSRGGLRASRIRALAARRVGRGHPAAAGLDFEPQFAPVADGQPCGLSGDLRAPPAGTARRDSSATIARSRGSTACSCT